MKVNSETLGRTIHRLMSSTYSTWVTGQVHGPTLGTQEPRYWTADRPTRRTPKLFQVLEDGKAATNINSTWDEINSIEDMDYELTNSSAARWTTGTWESTHQPSWTWDEIRKLGIQVHGPRYLNRSNMENAAT